LTNETLPAYFGLVGRPNARGSYASACLAWGGKESCIYILLISQLGGILCGARKNKYDPTHACGEEGNNFI